MKAIMRIVGFAALLATLASTPTYAQLSNILGANFTISPDGKTLHLTGDITGATPFRLKRYLMQLPDIEVIELDSWGGETYAALALALEIHERGLDTAVPSGAGCYSSCAYVLLAGQRRQVEGELGVHTISADGGLFPGEEAQTFRDVEQVMQLVGAAPAIVEIARSTPAADMHVFSPDELQRFGILRKSTD